MLESVHVPLPAAVLLTSRAQAWLLPRVHTAKRGLLPEGPVAFPTEDWPLLDGLALVSLHAVLQDKALVTQGTLGRALPLVQEVVAEKGPLVMEAHITFRALYRTFPSIGGHMSKQILLWAEAAHTLMTPEVSLSPRDAPLRLWISLFAEFLPGPMRLVLQVAPVVLL